MKKQTLIAMSLIAFSALMSACGSKQTEENTENTEVSESTEAVNYPVVAAASTVVWKGEMLGIKFHDGTIGIKEGSVSLAGNAVTGGSFTIDMATIKTTDANYDADNTSEKLIGHLSSPDFFAIDSFPTATFTINSVSENSATGTLTIRGISNEETVENITVTEAEGATTISGKLTFNRKNYNVQWDAPLKEVILSNDVPLNISLVVKK